MKTSLGCEPAYEKVSSYFVLSSWDESCFQLDNDDAIEALHAAVKRQKEIGIAMTGEVDRHNEVIDTITDRTGLLDSRVKRQTMLVKTIHRKSSACVLWMVAFLLFVAIIVIVSVPFKK